MGISKLYITDTKLTNNTKTEKKKKKIVHTQKCRTKKKIVIQVAI